MVVDNLPARSIIWFFPYVLIDLDKRKDSASVLSHLDIHSTAFRLVYGEIRDNTDFDIHPPLGFGHLHHEMQTVKAEWQKRYRDHLIWVFFAFLSLAKKICRIISTHR